MASTWVQPQTITDPELRERLIAVVDQAIAAAPAEVVDVDTEDGVTHTSVWWTWRDRADPSAQKTVHANGTDVQLLVEQLDDPDAGPWLGTSGESGVMWSLGLGFEMAEKFLAWFEDGLP
jgi:hypothetical protein